MIVDTEISALRSLAGICEGGPVDLADNHELYLRGELPPEYAVT